jgi:hypothetical protein
MMHDVPLNELFEFAAMIITSSLPLTNLRGLEHIEAIYNETQGIISKFIKDDDSSTHHKRPVDNALEVVKQAAKRAHIDDWYKGYNLFMDVYSNTQPKSIIKQFDKSMIEWHRFNENEKQHWNACAQEILLQNKWSRVEVAAGMCIFVNDVKSKNVDTKGEKLYTYCILEWMKTTDDEKDMWILMSNHIKNASKNKMKL